LRKFKKNQSGFTLVELIVVVALMAIVFGALIKVIQPTNQFFKDTEAFKDEVMISEGLTEALASEIRYSTNVVVLQNYVGVPKFTATGELAGIPDITFDSAIMIDNDAVRGAYTNDYATNMNSTASRRRGAKGQILTFEVGGLGINFNVSEMLYNEAYYADYQYEFDVTGKNDENGRSYVDFGVVMNDLVADGDKYVINEDYYESSDFLYLKNINLNDNDGYRLYVKDFGGSVDDDDYIGFERAAESATTVNTDIQRALYDGSDTDNVHNWIIYFKGSSIDASSSVTITFDPKEGGAGTTTMTAQTGKPFNQNPPVFPTAGHDLYEKDGKTYTRRFVGWVSTLNPSATPLTNEALMAYIPVTDETFYAVYQQADVTYTVSFYDAMGSVIQNDVNVLHGTAVTPPDMTSTVPAGYSGYVWKRKGTNIIVDNSIFNAITEGLELEPHYFNIYKVRFMKENRTTELESHNVISGSAFTSIPAVPPKPGYTGEWKRLNADNSLTTPDYSVITENCTFVPVYTEIPVNKPNINITNVAVQNLGWTGSIKFDISNVGTADAKTIKLRIPMNKPITSLQHNTSIFHYGSNYKIDKTGNDIIVEIEFTAVKCSPGSTHTIELWYQPVDATRNGEIVITELTF